MVPLGIETVRRPSLCLVRYPDLVASFTVKKSPAMQTMGRYPNNCSVLVGVLYNSKVSLPRLKFHMHAVTDFYLGPVLTESIWRAHSRLTFLLLSSSPGSRVAHVACPVT
jgi:hypothetical protein